MLDFLGIREIIGEVPLGLCGWAAAYKFEKIIMIDQSLATTSHRRHLNPGLHSSPHLGCAFNTSRQSSTDAITVKTKRRVYGMETEEPAPSERNREEDCPNCAAAAAAAAAASTEPESESTPPGSQEVGEGEA